MNAKEWLNLSWIIADDANAKDDAYDLMKDELNLSSICADKALHLDINLSQAWEQKGDLLNQAGRYEEAAASYDRSLEEDPLNHGVWLKKGQALDVLKRWSEAINCYNMAISCCQLRTSSGVPDNIVKKVEGDAWCNKARDGFQMKNYNKALLCYNRSIEIYSDPNISEDKNGIVNAWMGKGNSLRAMGDYEEAMQCYDEIISNLGVSDSALWVADALSAKGLSEFLLAEELNSMDDLNALLHYNLSVTYFAKAIDTLENDANLTNDNDTWSDYFGKWMALHHLPGREKDASDAIDRSISLAGGTVMPSWGSLMAQSHNSFTRAMEILRNVSVQG